MAEIWIVEAVPSDDPTEQEAARLWNEMGGDALDVMTEGQLSALNRIWERDTFLCSRCSHDYATHSVGRLGRHCASDGCNCRKFVGET